jgi:hypothetical protein
MTTFTYWATLLPAVLFGAVVMGAVGLPLAYRRGRERTAEESRIYEGLELIREHDALPPQYGTKAEHDRRLEVRAVPQTPIGAEPVPGISRDRSGLASPAAADAARSLGNAAPPLDAQTPPGTGDPAGLQWPLSWRVLWPVLLFVAHFWYTPAGNRVDRAAVWLGRHERRWFRHHKHATRVLHGEAERRRRALLEPTQELTTVPLVPKVPSIRHLDPDWRGGVEEIPVAHIGELVGAK